MNQHRVSRVNAFTRNWKLANYISLYQDNPSEKALSECNQNQGAT